MIAFETGGIEANSESTLTNLELLKLSHVKKSSLNSFSVNDTLGLTCKVLQNQEDNCKKSGLFTEVERQTVISHWSQIKCYISLKLVCLPF